MILQTCLDDRPSWFGAHQPRTVHRGDDGVVQPPLVRRRAGGSAAQRYFYHASTSPLHLFT
jgi:hypothetical protein